MTEPSLFARVVAFIGQGAVLIRHSGDGPRQPVFGTTPAIPGVMTKGILDKNDYYYRRVFTDAVRAVDDVEPAAGRVDRVAA